MMEYRMVEEQSADIISKTEFWERKVDWFVRMWKFGRHDDETFARNMQIMGYEEETIRECIDDYYGEDE